MTFKFLFCEVQLLRADRNSYDIPLFIKHHQNQGECTRENFIWILDIVDFHIWLPGCWLAQTRENGWGRDYGDWSRWWLSGTYWCRWWPIFSRCHRNYQVMGVLAGTPGHLVNMVNTHSSSFGHLGKPSREFLGTVWNTRYYLESYNHHLTSKREFYIPIKFYGPGNEMVISNKCDIE